MVQRSHILQPLTALTSKKVNFKWAVGKQKALNKIKQIVARNILLIYQDFNKCFSIHTDGSEFQLIEVIIQDVKPIAFYSCKLTGPQTQYIVTEK